MNHLTIPKQANTHKKKNKVEIKLPIICNIVFVLLIAFQIFQLIKIKHTIEVLGISINLESAQILNLVNIQRQESNLTPLVINDQLNQAALNKASDMFVQNYWDHYAPNSQTPWQFITQTGYVYRYAGENLAKDYSDEYAVVRAWMESPGHRSNILSDKFTQTGIATVKGELNGQDSILIVQLFATPFTTQELTLLNEKGAVIVNQTSQLQPPIIKPTYANLFGSTKLVMSILIILLIIALGFDIKQQSKKIRFRQLAKRYWLNLSLLLITGTLYLLTYSYN